MNTDLAAVIDIESDEKNINNDPGNDPMIVNRQASDANDLFGMIVNSEEEAYNLYNGYAARIGFSVRKAQKRKLNNVLRHVNYVCSKEGFQEDGDPSEVKKTFRLDTRTSCPTRIRFALEDNNVWKVSLFVPEHNHKLAEPDERPFLRSNRKISKAHAGVIKSMISAGIRTTNTYSYLAEEVGGSLR